MAEKPQSPSEPGVSDLRDELEKLRADFNRLLESAGKATQAGLEDASGEAGRAADDVNAWAEGQCASLRDTVRARPVASCLVAAGIGLVVGQILLRR